MDLQFKCCVSFCSLRYKIKREYFLFRSFLKDSFREVYVRQCIGSMFSQTPNNPWDYSHVHSLEVEDILGNE